MYVKGQLIEVEIADAGEGHVCFGKMPDGLAVFIAGMVAVGDRVEASVSKIKKNYLEARLTRVLSPSALRIEPACPHFGGCGGCKWQHATYSEQLRVKRKIVSDALAHLGGFVGHAVAEPIPSPDIFGYRNKLEFSFGDRRYRLPEEMELSEASLTKPSNFALGFHSPGRFDKVVDIDACLLGPSEMNEALALVKAFCRERGLSIYNTREHQGFLRNLVVRKAHATGQFMVYLVTSSSDERQMAALDQALAAHFGTRLTTFVNGVTSRKNTVARGDEEIVIRGPGFITEKLGALQFAISPTSFFQTNTRQAERLYDEALRVAAPRPTDIVHDLYCGTGTISLWLAPHCRAVVGCELEASSLRDAEANAKTNGIGNAQFLALDLKHYAKAVRELPSDMRPDVVVVDPPRAGLHPDLVAELRSLRPERIVYVSCNPASLARDAQAICADGAYALGPVQPVDLFPHTGHVESVASLTRA
ncbi:MAG: 23S rRNA (uracil(1939)-C(5))-methyltransferase RlmD [Kiritimatiellae bacterium]|nr:23S rRNA (uracil(1939)-C(5))-methyltransferase RlmD [Kiritimatiellia bacterium]MCO6399944.1 23S rRNA (uracil(1939)-C(5))-methyltransferase RlmD [Verrucomicrobiota bacterium]